MLNSITPPKPTWYILGAGAIGCLWASCWRQAGFRVVLLTTAAREQHSITLLRNNQSIETKIEQLTVAQLNASNIRIKYLLVTTKAQQTLTAVDKIKNHLAKNATVLVLQNGMAVTKLSDALPEQTIIAATTTDGVYRTAPMTIVHAGLGETFFGNKAKALLAILPTAYLTIHSCDNIEARLWQKLAINCAINGLTAIYRCNNGELLNKPEAMARINTLCNEIITVASAAGFSASVQQLHTKVQQTLQTTASNYSSMYQDIANHRLSEIDYINGYLCELAATHGINCNENSQIVNEIKQLEQANVVL
ncbi:MAG: 2-dehydropantoate 2-reductase [Spongiibacteraceae bacterium]